MEIRSLAGVCEDAVLDAFQEAFGDYAVNFDRDGVRDMLVRRGFCADLSFAFFDNGRIVAFILNGAGMYDGVKSCYDCGTATVPDFRGRGLARELFAHSLPVLRENGIEQYVLEVLQDNSAAISLYGKQGFSVTESYDCFNGSVSGIEFLKPFPAGIEVRDISIEDLRGLLGFCDFRPSWQNDIESLCRGAASLVKRGAYTHDGEPVGYCVSDPVSGDISQIAVAKDCRRRGVASMLLSDAISFFTSSTIKVLNVEAGNIPLPKFLEAVNIPRGLSQYAMRKVIG